MKPLLLLSAGLLGTAFATGAVITEPTRNFVVGVDLADLSDPPENFLAVIDDSAIASLTEVRVGLHLVGRGDGGFASEMYVALNKDLSVTSVLLNQVGVTGANPVGFSYDGWNVTFADSAPGGDVHLVPQILDVLAGEFMPDGRTAPDSTERPAMLDQFVGETGNGAWRLSVADLGLGGTMRLESWSLTLTGEAGPAQVPEAPTWIAGLATVALLAWSRRRAHSGAKAHGSSTRSNR